MDILRVVHLNFFYKRQNRFKTFVHLVHGNTYTLQFLLSLRSSTTATRLPPRPRFRLGACRRKQESIKPQFRPKQDGVSHCVALQTYETPLFRVVPKKQQTGHYHTKVTL